jgi:hypothetical protein
VIRPDFSEMLKYYKIVIPSREATPLKSGQISDKLRYDGVKPDI